MKILKSFSPEAVKFVSKGGIGVIPTDTLYGIVCSALSKKAVEKVYRLRKRSPSKPVIVLIGSLRDMKKFGISLNPISQKITEKVWPGPISVILKLSDKGQVTRDKFKYLHRGKNAIAFRLPKKAALRRFLAKTGPLIAPSANFEGKTPARTIKEAQKYFGDKIDFYVDGGNIESNPSTLVLVLGGKVSVLRKGAGVSKLRNVSA